MRRHRESRVVPPEETPRDWDEPIVSETNIATPQFFAYLLKFDLSRLSFSDFVMRRMHLTFRKYRSPICMLQNYNS